MVGEKGARKKDSEKCDNYEYIRVYSVVMGDALCGFEHHRFWRSYDWEDSAAFKKTSVVLFGPKVRLPVAAMMMRERV